MVDKRTRPRKVQKNDLVSIILPVFNGEVYLRECLDSIKAQTYKNWEIVAVDDGSTDNSFRILKEYCNPIHTKNQGEGLARNLAFKHCKGKYIACFDADDVMAADRLVKSIRGIGKYDVVYSGYMIIDDKSHPVDLYDPPPFNKENFLLNQVIPHSTMFLRRETFVPYRDFKFSADMAFIWDLVKSGARFKKINEPLMAYRISPQSMSSTFKQQEKDKWKNKVIKEMEVNSETIWNGQKR